MNNLEKYKNSYTINQSYEPNKSINTNHKQQLIQIINKMMLELRKQTITEKDQETIKNYKQEINNAIYQIQTISTLAKEMKEIDQEDYESMLKMIENYYSQYLTITNILASQKKQVKKIKNIKNKKTDEETKNILVFLKDKKTEDFCMLKDLEANGKKDLQSLFHKALASNIKKLTSSYFEDIRSTQKIKKIKNNSLPTKRDETYPWEVRRKDSTRMSIIFLKTCPENLEKIKTFYNLPKLENIILVGGIIKVADEYNKLAPLTKQIEDNRDYINYLNSLFSNPNTNIDTLNKIISESEIIDKTLKDSPKQK